MDRDEEEVKDVGVMEVDGREEMGGRERKECGGMGFVEGFGKRRDGNRDWYDVMMVCSGMVDGSEKVEMEER